MSPSRDEDRRPWGPPILRWCTAVEAVWRIESARIVAVLARLTGDVGLAEEIAQDTLVVALEQWPRDGVPDDPGPWLMATAKHRAIDPIRRRQNVRRESSSWSAGEHGRTDRRRSTDRRVLDDGRSATTCSG